MCLSLYPSLIFADKGRSLPLGCSLVQFFYSGRLPPCLQIGCSSNERTSLFQYKIYFSPTPSRRKRSKIGKCKWYIAKSKWLIFFFFCTVRFFCGNESNWLLHSFNYFVNLTFMIITHSTLGFIQYDLTFLAQKFASIELTYAA
jgi:hypothetical protein